MSLTLNCFADPSTVPAVGGQDPASSSLVFWSSGPLVTWSSGYDEPDSHVGYYGLCVSCLWFLFVC